MKQQGFSLIELLVVIAIVAILALIGYPSYQEYVRKSNHGDMKAEMMRISQEAQRYFSSQRNFRGMTLANLNSSGSFPADNPKYNLVINTLPSAGNANIDNRWELTATPIGGQASYGTIRLNSDGQKCWIKGESTCALSANSDW